MGKPGIRSALTVVAAAVAMVVSGCVQGPPMPVPTYTPRSTATPTPTMSPEPTPTLNPAGSANENRKYFNYVMAGYLAANSKADGRSIVDTLAAAGFAKPSMEVTPDRTSIGYDADAIIFSVLILDSCLVGQINPSGFHSEVARVLGTGRCLVGETRAITW